MTIFEPWLALAGGILIGLASVMLMLTIGRIAGICGILLSALQGADAREGTWRLAFLSGLPLGAFVVWAVGLKDWSAMSLPASPMMTILAGIAVGTGTTLGSGCTSGHGICGLARLSPRSIAATCVFMIVAALTVFVTRHVIPG
jgi:hypothetical protein